MLLRRLLLAGETISPRLGEQSQAEEEEEGKEASAKETGDEQDQEAGLMSKGTRPSHTANDWMLIAGKRHRRRSSAAQVSARAC